MRMGSYGTGFRHRGSHTDCMAESPLRSAAVKGLSRHILALKYRAPVFHGPLDSLALLRMNIVPITRNWKEPKNYRYRISIVRRRDTPLHILYRNVL